MYKLRIAFLLNIFLVALSLTQTRQSFSVGSHTAAAGEKVSGTLPIPAGR